MMLRSITVTSLLLCAWFLSACQTTTNPPPVDSLPGEAVYPVKVALGGHPGIGVVAITYIAFAVDARMQLSDGSWCYDRTQRDAKFKAGVYEGSFENCPGYTYNVEVRTPAVAALMLVQLNLANAPLDYTMDITTPTGILYENVPRAY